MTERVALITGASAGIGAELARVFASRGHRVAMVARRADRLTALAGEIVAAGGGTPIVIACDLTQTGAGDRIAESNPGENPARAWNSDGTGPGQTTVTRTPCGASSARIASVNDIT